MFRNVIHMHRALVGILLAAGPLTAQRVAKPPVQPWRVAGELGASMVGFVASAEGSLLVAAGLAYLVQGDFDDIRSPGLKRVATGMIVTGGGVGAATSSWLVSRQKGETSNWLVNAAVTTAVTALAFRYADWPMTDESRQRPMPGWKRAAPVWMSAISATVTATVTRRRR